MDELQRAERADINVLKDILTTDEVDYRVFYTQENEKVAQNCTFLGCTNRRVDIVIKDETGMRRFYEIVCPRPIVYSALDAVDILALWRGIDENRTELYIEPYREELNAAQEELKETDEYLDFVEEERLLPGTGESEFISSAILFGDWRLWASRNGYNEGNGKLFKKKMKSLGVAPSRKSNERGYTVRKGYKAEKADQHNNIASLEAERRKRG